MQFKHCDRFTVTFTIDLNISDSVKNFSIANSKERTKKEIKKQKHDKNPKLPGFLCFTVI